jgi:hypothetical protein
MSYCAIEPIFCDTFKGVSAPPRPFRNISYYPDIRLSGARLPQPLPRDRGSSEQREPEPVDGDDACMWHGRMAGPLRLEGPALCSPPSDTDQWSPAAAWVPHPCGSNASASACEGLSLAKKAAVKLEDFTALPFRQSGVVHRKGPPDPRGPPTEAWWLLMPSGTLVDPMGHERTAEAHDQNARSYDADQVN